MDVDRYGLEVSTTSDAAAEAYRAGIDCMLAAWPGAAGHLDRAIALDPEFALAHIARGRVHQMYAELAEARTCTATAGRLLTGATLRERQHAGIMTAAIEGRSADAIRLAEAHLDDHPRDALVMTLLLGAFGLYAFSGRPDHDSARLSLCQRHARHYGDDWWFLTYLGWSNTEAGHVGPGRSITEKALELRRENANAAHALSHAMFEAGDSTGAQRFLSGWMPGYDRDGLLNGHISWHQALAAIESDDLDTALRIYRERLAPGIATGAPLNVYTDAASLLWRLGLEGRGGMGAEWASVLNYAKARFPKPAPPFAAIHAGLLRATVAGTNQAASALAELETALADGKLAPGAAVVALVRGTRAFAEGDYRTATRLLTEAMPDLVRVGGSHAQREMFEDTLIVASLKAGEPERARELIDARLHRRPSARDQRWRTMAA